MFVVDTSVCAHGVQARGLRLGACERGRWSFCCVSSVFRRYSTSGGRRPSLRKPHHRRPLAPLFRPRPAAPIRQALLTCLQKIHRYLPMDRGGHDCYVPRCHRCHRRLLPVSRFREGSFRHEPATGQGRQGGDDEQNGSCSPRRRPQYPPGIGRPTNSIVTCLLGDTCFAESYSAPCLLPARTLPVPRPTIRPATRNARKKVRPARSAGLVPSPTVSQAHLSMRT
jgi:hypothetical protein